MRSQVAVGVKKREALVDGEIPEDEKGKSSSQMRVSPTRGIPNRGRLTNEEAQPRQNSTS